jgi:hypothetical protein
MLSLRVIPQALRDLAFLQLGKHYPSTGTHFSTARRVRSWCSKSGLRVDRTLELQGPPPATRLGKIATGIGLWLPAPFTTSIATSIVVAATQLQDERGQRRAAEPALTEPNEDFAIQ